MPLKVWPKWYVRGEIAVTPGTFVFGDNMIRKGQRGQACIRGLPNAYGIPTKFYPSMEAVAFFRDELSHKFDDSVIFHFVKLEQRLQRGELVYWPFGGIGTDLARWSDFCPQFQKRVDDILEDLKNRYA